MRKFGLLFCMVVVFLPPLARADALTSRLDALEKTVQSMQNDSIERNEKVASSIALIDQIRQDYQTLQGSIDAANYIAGQQQAELSRLRRDFLDRMAAIEERMEISDQQITKAVAKVLPQLTNETENYKNALDLIQKSDFLSAVAAFRNFLKAYPRSELADNAQYWIGECYYALKDFPKAIKEFQAVVEKYPKFDKAVSAILKQGLSFSELGMIEEAKTFLNKVLKDYVGSDEAVRAREKLDRIEQKKNDAAASSPAAAQPGNQPGTSVIDSNTSFPLAPGVKQQPATVSPPQPQVVPKNEKP